MLLLVLTRFQEPPHYPPPPAQKLPLLASLYWIGPLLLWCYSRLIAHQPLSAYGMTWSWDWGRGLLLGLGLGIGGIALLLGLQRWAAIAFAPSHASVEAQPQAAASSSAAVVPLLLLLTLAISWVEELVFRGFVVNELLTAYSVTVMVVLSSALFAVLHLVWDGRAGLPQLPGLWLMGSVLVLARWVDGGSLGLPCGLHAGWIFSLAVLDTWGIPLMSAEAPPWLVGQLGQPLTGLLPLGLLTLTAAGLAGFKVWAGG